MGKIAGTIVERPRLTILLASLTAMIAAPTASVAQGTDYPKQRITFIVGFRRRRVRRHDRALGRGKARRAHRTSGRCAEHGGRRRHSRGTTGRDVAAGRLHHPGHDDVTRDQRIAGAGSRLHRCRARGGLVAGVGAGIAFGQRQIAGQDAGRSRQGGQGRNGVHGVGRHRHRIAHRGRILLQDTGEGAGEAHSLPGRQSGHDGAAHWRRDRPRCYGDGTWCATSTTAT